jgi:hypothetical protein
MKACDFVSDTGACPTAKKTTDVGALTKSYRFMNQRWSSASDAPEAGGLENVFLIALFGLQRSNGCSNSPGDRESRRENAVAKALRTVKLEEQTYGDGCPRTPHMKGVVPCMNGRFDRTVMTVHRWTSNILSSI